MMAPGKPGRRGRPVAGRATMSAGIGTLLITVGAILVFALTARSPAWFNLRAVGVILMLAGVLGLAIPGLARARAARSRRRAQMLPEPGNQSAADLEKDLIRRPSPNGDGPALADAIPRRREHDPPI
jgi:hypothetical protein